MLEKHDFFQRFFVISLRFDLEVKGHMGQGQMSRGSRSNKGSKQRQVGSWQRQVASLYKVKDTITFLYKFLFFNFYLRMKLW